MKITRYLDPDQGQGGQGATELEKSVFGSFGQTKPVGEEGGAGAGGQGAGAIVDTPEKLAADQATLEGLLEKDEATLTAEEKVAFAALKLKFDIKPVKADGTPLTDAEKLALEATDKKIKAIQAKPEAQRTLEEIGFLKENTTPEVNVYEEVDQLSGIPVNVDYGNVSPNSAEGILKREQIIREQAADEYDQQLKDEVPLAYQFMLHLKAGGSPETFLERDTENYQEMVLAKGDAITQEKLYRKALTLKGNNADQVDALVQHAKDKGKLYDFSNAELIALQRKQLIDEQTKVNTVKQQQVKQKAVEDSFFGELDKSLKTGVQGVVIPIVDQKPFSKFVQEKIFVQNGELLQVSKLDPKNLGEFLAAEYFRFKKGNLKELAERKALSLNVSKIQGKIKYSVVPKVTGDGGKKMVPMSQV